MQQVNNNKCRPSLKKKKYLPEPQSPHISYLFDLILDMFTRFLSLFAKHIQFNEKNNNKNILIEKKKKIKN